MTARPARAWAFTSLASMRELSEVYYVDGVRSAFGRAGPKGVFWRTRADDMAVKLVRELLRRNDSLPPERIDDVVLAATAQVGDQGLTLGRDVALLAGLPRTVPGFAVDRMCAGALTAITAGAGEIAMGAADVILAGGVEHMGRHPMLEDVEYNPRFVAERLIDPSAATMGQTAENLHDRLAARIRAGGRGARARAEAPARFIRIRRRRAGADGHGTGAGDEESARASRTEHRPDRRLRAQRALRRASADVVRRHGNLAGRRAA